MPKPPPKESARVSPDLGRDRRVKQYDRLLTDKANKEIASILKTFPTTSLKFAELAQVLDSLQVTESTKERGLAKEIWALLKGDTYGEITKQALEAFLQAVLNPRNLSPGRSKEGATSGVKSVGTFTETDKGTVFSLTEKEKEYLYQKYSMRIKCNKLCRSGSSGRSNSRDQPKDKPLFSPRINQKSSQIAVSARYKALGHPAAAGDTSDSKSSELSKVSVTDLLMYHKVLYERHDFFNIRTAL